MHSSCNTKKAAGLTEWPRFRCSCHFLQVENGHLFVRTRGRAGSEKHLLLPNIVSPSRDKVDARVVVGPGKLGGQKVLGASAGMKAEFGYMLPGIRQATISSPLPTATSRIREPGSRANPNHERVALPRIREAGRFAPVAPNAARRGPIQQEG